LFARTYTVGEKESYSASQSLKNTADSASSVDIDLTVTKLLDQGKADIGVHFSDLKVAPGAGALAPDLTLATGPNNMPVDFSPKDRTTEATLPFMFLAGATMDKQAIVGDEAPLKWHCSLIDFDGTIKVLEISDKKTLRARIKVAVGVQGLKLGDMTLTSDYSLPDCSLIGSSGEFTIGAIVQDFKFTKKPGT